MPLQVIRLQRSHENLVLILIPIKPLPTCQRQQCDTTTTQPQESSPEQPPPSTASLAGRNQQLLRHRMSLPAHAAPAAGSRLPPKTPWECSCPAIAATDNTRHSCCWASTVHSVHTDLLNACGLKEIICYGAGVGYRRPSVGSLLCHTLLRMLVYFLETQFMVTEMTPRLPDSHAGARGRWLPFRERSSQSVHIWSDTAGEAKNWVDLGLRAQMSESR